LWPWLEQRCSKHTANIHFDGGSGGKMTATTKDFCDDHAGTPVDAADSGIEEGGFDREAALVVVRRLFALLQGDILGLDDLLLQIVASQTDDPEVHKLAAMSERVRVWRYAPPNENSFDRDIRLVMLQDAQDDMSAAGERVVALLAPWTDRVGELLRELEGRQVLSVRTAQIEGVDATIVRRGSVILTNTGPAPTSAS
jgi:hypothetical protein